MIEPLTCCINSVNQIINLKFDSVTILGDGPIGLMQLMLIRKFFKVNVSVIGKIRYRLELAKQLGSDNIILINDDKDNNNLDEFKNNIISNTDTKFSPNVIFVSNNNPFSINMALKLVNKMEK